jgi:hypothetical protein
MNRIVRNVLAVILGFVLGGMVNMTLVVLGPKLIPPPPGVNMSDPQSLAASIQLLEPRHFIFPFLAHALGTLAGAFTAYMVAASHRSAFSYALGAINLAGGIAAVFMIPAPVWFIALDLIAAYLPMAWLATQIGARLHQTPPPTPPAV